MDITLGLTIFNSCFILFLLHRAVETKEVINRFGGIVNSNFDKITGYFDDLQKYLKSVEALRKNTGKRKKIK